MRDPKNEATVIMAKCRKTKQPFGIRTERMIDNVWHCTWAFRLGEQAAAREGYQDVLVKGRMAVDDEYPGCPYCESSAWFSCGRCGRLTCFENESTVTCAWCGNSGTVETADTFDLKGGGY